MKLFVILFSAIGAFALVSMLGFANGGIATVFGYAITTGLIAFFVGGFAAYKAM